MWFDTWNDLMRVALVGVSAYATVVLVLRVSGKRTLAKLNAFDFVVTVAIGSTLATILLNSDVSWSEGAVALGVLAGLQLLAALVSSRLPRGRAVLTSSPRLLWAEDGPDLEAMREQRVSMDELRQAVRSTGTGDLGRVERVVLESDGSLSVITRRRLGDGSALRGVRR